MRQQLIFFAKVKRFCKISSSREGVNAIPPLLRTPLIVNHLVFKWVLNSRAKRFFFVYFWLVLDFPSYASKLNGTFVGNQILKHATKADCFFLMNILTVMTEVWNHLLNNTEKLWKHTWCKIGKRFHLHHFITWRQSCAASKMQIPFSISKPCPWHAQSCS